MAISFIRNAAFAEPDRSHDLSGFLSVMHINAYFFRKVIAKIKIIVYNTRCLTSGNTARGKAALVGEIAVPCTCNPLQQG